MAVLLATNSIARLLHYYQLPAKEHHINEVRFLAEPDSFRKQTPRFTCCSFRPAPQPYYSVLFEWICAGFALLGFFAFLLLLY